MTRITQIAEWLDASSALPRHRRGWGGARKLSAIRVIRVMRAISVIGVIRVPCNRIDPLPISVLD